MANEIATQTTSAPKPPVKAGGPLQALVPTNIEEAFRLATALASSGDMVPKAFQNNAPACMAAIVRGMEVGLAPMQALSSIAVINGRATIWGDAVPALVQRAGHTVDVEYEGSGDNLTAVATLTRGDNGKVIVRRFGLAEARRAGLLGKQGPWQQYPQRMIAHRARSWAVRDGAADALMGLGVADDQPNMGPDRARDITPAPRRGGVVYADDAAPEVDEVIDGTTHPTPDQIAAAMQAAQEESEHAEREGLAAE